MINQENQGRSFRIIEATTDRVQQLEKAVEKRIPLIGASEFAAFVAGDIPTGRFDLRSPDHASLVIATALARAQNPNDPLYCLHAAESHQKTYLDVLRASLDNGVVNWQIQDFTQTDVKTARAYTANRMVLEADERTRTILTPYPLAQSFSIRNPQHSPQRTIQELIGRLKDLSIHPMSSLMAGIYAGVQPYDIIGNDKWKLRGVLEIAKVQDNIRLHIGKLSKERIEALHNAVNVLFYSLLVPGTLFPSFGPGVYREALLYLERYKLIKTADMRNPEFTFVEQSHRVVPRVVFKGASEIAQELEEARLLYGDFRTTKILELFGRDISTELVTAYFDFKD